MSPCPAQRRIPSIIPHRFSVCFTPPCCTVCIYPTTHIHLTLVPTNTRIQSPFTFILGGEGRGRDGIGGEGRNIHMAYTPPRTNAPTTRIFVTVRRAMPTITRPLLPSYYIYAVARGQQRFMVVMMYQVHLYHLNVTPSTYH